MSTPFANIAVDVVVLPPPEIAAWAISCNRAMLAAGEPGFALDATHLPHVTLLQQCVNVTRLDELIGAVGLTIRAFPPLSLTITHCRRTGTSSSALVEPTPDLQRLHEVVLATCEPFVGPEASADAFFSDDEPVRERDVQWLARFRRDVSGQHFDPHITLGVGPAPELSEPLRFMADQIAVCQLGRFSTCRKVLAKWSLQSSRAR